MDTKDFDQLAGRIEGVARAVLLLAQMMERETDMDGLTLTHQWRKSLAPQGDGDTPSTAHKTLLGLAQALDDARSRYQESFAAALLADPALQQAHMDARPPVGHRHLDALDHRLSQAEHRLDQMDGTAPACPHGR